MNKRYFLTQRVIPELPKHINVKEVSADCFRMKNLENGKILHYYLRAEKVFINSDNVWINSINVFQIKVILHQKLIPNVNPLPIPANPPDTQRAKRVYRLKRKFIP